jgi:hypothetical protein
MDAAVVFDNLEQKCDRCDRILPTNEWQVRPLTFFEFKMRSFAHSLRKNKNNFELVNSGYKPPPKSLIWRSTREW